MSAASTVEATHTLPDGRTVPVSRLTSSAASRRFLLTNQAPYFLTYHGLVIALEKRRSHGWQAFGSYTARRRMGCRRRAGPARLGPRRAPSARPTRSSSAAIPTTSSTPPAACPTIGRTCSGSWAVSTSPGQASCSPPTCNTSVASRGPRPRRSALPQGDVRILLEPRGSRRLSSQTLLDVRLSRTLSLRRLGRIEVLVDVLNALNDPAEEALATDNVLAQTFGRGVAFVDPRRAMVGLRLNLGELASRSDALFPLPR